MNTNITSVDIKNALLATPLTKDGRVSIGKTLKHRDANKDEFLKNCFIEADFVSQAILEEKVNSGEEQYWLHKNEDYDFFALSADAQKKYKYRIKWRSEEAQKEQFEKDLIGASSNDSVHRTYSSIFLIEGPAGCGKTTYANHLLQNGFKCDICDVETATQKSCGCFAKTYDFKAKNSNPITAVEMLLLSKIQGNLGKQYEESFESYIMRIKDICKIYYQQFNTNKIPTKDSPEYRQFFESLYSFCNGEKNYEELSEEIYQQIDTFITNSDHIIEDKIPYDKVDAIKFLLGILMRTYFCLSKLNGDKYILFLDNIERFIISETGKPYIAVFDSELQKILNSFYSVADETEDIIYKTFDELSNIDNNIVYITTFGILITVRESTLNLLKSNHSFAEYFEKHHSERFPTYVNISNWFDFEKVFIKKIEFFLGITGENDNIYIKTFNNILNDITLSKWSLRNLLLNMFNNNFRRFFENMTEVFCNYEDVIVFYNKYWDLVKNKSNPETQHIKHLCRKIIIRIVLDYMQNVKPTFIQQGFFDELMARCDDESPTGDAIAKSSYARRIFTCLDNMNKMGNEAPVSFPQLIQAVLHKPILKSIKSSNVQINDNRIGDIANIIVFSSQTAKIHTNGVELVTLNVDSSEIGKYDLSKMMKEQWNIYRTWGETNYEKFNIKITPAGSVFAMLFPCFEYFACRYKNNSIPLFMLKTELERRKLIFGTEKSDKSSSEDEIGIYNKAINCIDSVLKLETRFLALTPIKRKSPECATYARPKWIYDYDGDGSGMVHALRIICDHLGYLQDYRQFLIDINDDTFDAQHYINNDGKGVIDEAIEKYKEKYAEIVKKYKSYIEIGNIPKI